jgi:redox-sensitive bicupin YhaK (pirin superfamily)
MSAVTGITHAVYNKENVTTRIFQIWIQPTRSGEKPSSGARPFPKGYAPALCDPRSGFDNDDDALPIRTNARVVARTAAFC